MLILTVIVHIVDAGKSELQIIIFSEPSVVVTCLLNSFAHRIVTLGSVVEKLSQVF